MHDSVKALVMPEVRIKCANILRKYAEREFIINGRSMIIPADFKVSVPDDFGIHRYSTLKKLKLERL